MKRHVYKLSILVVFLYTNCENYWLKPRLEYEKLAVYNTAMYSDSLSQRLLGLYEENSIPGFAAAKISSNGNTYVKCFGYSDIEAKVPYNMNTRQNIASVSKSFIGLAIFKLIEASKLSLDTPINSILPFDVLNPKFPDSTITLEHLASHSSGIIDNSIEKQSFYSTESKGLKRKVWKDARLDFESWSNNQPYELGTLLKESLTKNGSLFNKERFSNSKPGTSYAYSNLGASLAAYVIELRTGMTYKDYMEKEFFEVLGLNSTTFEILQNDSYSKKYFQNLVEVPTYYPNLYPSGGIYSTITDLSMYLQEFIKLSKGESNLLKRESFIEMTNPRNFSNEPTNSFGLFLELDKNSIGHNGGNYGTTVLMEFDPITQNGRVLMANISSYYNDKTLKEIVKIWKTLE